MRTTSSRRKLVTGIVCGCALAGSVWAQGPGERRAALLRLVGEGAAAVPRLTAGLNDENVVVRRTAARLLARLGKEGREPLTQALTNSDSLVRLIALRALLGSHGQRMVPLLKTALGDENVVIRQAAVAALADREPQTAEVKALLETAAKDPVEAVRNIAAKALWPFHKEVTSVRDRKDWDHVIEVAKTIPLPEDGWRFKLDPARDGHLKKWYRPDFDDSAWERVRIGKSWEEQGHTYDGVAWYRRTFILPDKPPQLATELRFDAVDECAWVWVNGTYVGQHDVGPEGWDQPFTLDVTGALKWHGRNQVTVRVFDSKYAGGIWKPVRLEVLK